MRTLASFRDPSARMRKSPENRARYLKRYLLESPRPASGDERAFGSAIDEATDSAIDEATQLL